MHLERKSLYGFEFAKIGTFHITEEPHPVICDGINDHIQVEMRLISEKFASADESVYLIYVNDVLHYVGEYSYSLKERWGLRKGRYIWHHKDVKIEEALRNNSIVDIWIIVEPYICTDDGSKINISKSIEQEILKRKKPIWNTRGQLEKWASWRQKHCKKLVDIIQDLT